jgi:uncharacterized C2H2 Zn-finger protein
MENDKIIGRCPNCSYITEEAFDYDSQGNEVFQCGSCGVVFAEPESGPAIVIDPEGAFTVPIVGGDEFDYFPEEAAE